MTYEEFSTLSAEEQAAVFVDSKTVDDLTAERDSFKTENEQLQQQLAELKEDNRKTKEMNYTLTRKLSVEPRKTAEEYLNEMFKQKG